ncbi:hypothetical protein NLI96_g7439 [Meripilus lineatus]|uniref:Polyketide synthase phosphopantetheine-binding domain-containing protein n=1 Tax=Meripilus lineatus TaxID=2056292 RepID=A0AAD5UZD8_9APHY|nr:hypothetical protein NLI96_g7439 [Physisporinus lineatus]
MSQTSYKIVPIPPFPQTQGLTTKTFTLPPLDGSMTMPEIYDFHLKSSPDHPLFVFPEDDGTERVINWAEAVRAFHRAGHIVHSHFDLKRQEGSPPPIVAILSAADLITYYTTFVGILRSGCTPFAISPRNSPAAIAHLLAKTGTKNVLLGREPAFQHLSGAAFKILESQGNTPPKTALLPTFEELYVPNSEENFEPLPPPTTTLYDIAHMFHSSGSTAFPKPIYNEHFTFIQHSLLFYFGEQDMTGLRLAAQSMPMFHAMGIALTSWAPASGLIIATFKPKIPATLPTAEAVIEGAITTKSDIVFSVPSFVEAWSRNPDHVRYLQHTKGILYGGGPLHKEVGDDLTAKGIPLFILYGCSEVGIVTPLLPNPPGSEWDYFKISKSIRAHIKPEANGNAELVIIPGPFNVPVVFNTKVDGVDAFATNDLIMPHPTKPGYWKIVGRADDQIMHNTGEKTNPGPLEGILNQDPHVHASIMFGRGKFNAGVLIDPKPEFKFDRNDPGKLAEFRNKIWPTVEKLNAYAPQHSRLFKEMIIITDPAKPFTYTAKNTLRRQAIVAEYEPEIEALYAAVDETTQADLTPPASWDLPSTTEFVKAVVTRVLKQSVKDTDDIFQQSCDSLQATWIRNSLVHALKGTNVNTRLIPNSFVYQNPSISALSKAVADLATSPSQTKKIDIDARVAAMEALVKKYGTNFPEHVPSSVSQQTGDVLLVTGTTGALGATILSKAVQDPSVEKIYAVNRKGLDGRSLIERQRTILADRGLDLAILESPKVVLVEADLNADNLGLQSDKLDEIRSSVTHIIHNAYRVDFNLTLTSFEPNIKTIRQLIDLSLSSPRPSPARILFISSIGVLRNYEGDGPIKEEHVQPAVAVGSGYGESKWVGERLLELATSETPIQASTIRVGQISGGANGAWNTSEWVPALIKSSIHLKNLPSIDKDISWIPAEATAQAIIDLRKSTATVLHVANPHRVSWDTIFAPLAKTLNLPVIPYIQWLDLLEKSGENLDATSEVEALRTNPALRILEFFRSAKDVKSPKSTEAVGLPLLDTSAAQKDAPSLANITPVGKSDLNLWLAYWKHVGYL